MDDDRIVISSGSALSSEAVVNRTFATSFRGFDQAEVRMFLKRMGDDLEAAAQREAELRRALHEALNRAAHPELDEAVLTNALGEHTARLLTNARETAAAVISDAENRAARILQEGEARIARMRAEAETLLSRRAEEAERLSSGLRQAAETDARTVRDRARSDAQAEVEAARTQGREMLTEAKELRERMLNDLVRRRRMGEAQIQQLRAAHQRLLQAYEVVRRTLDEATGELSVAEAETRPAVDAVMARPPVAPAAAPPRPPAATPEFSPHPFPADVGQPRPGTPSPGPEVPSTPPEAAPGAPPASGAPAPPARPAPSVAGPVPSSSATQRRRGLGSQVPGPPRPVVDPAGVSALGAGDTPSESPVPDPDRPRTRLGTGGSGEVEARERSGPPMGGILDSATLPPVDLAAPGEEVRVVRETEEERAPAVAAEPPPGRESEAAREPVPELPPRRSRLRRRARAEQKEDEEGDERSSGAAAKVEELFARLRSAQAQSDAAPGDDAAPPGHLAGPDEEPGSGPAAEAQPGPARHPGDEHSAAAEAAQPGPQSKSQVADEKALYRRDELLDPIDSDLSRRLKRVLQDEQNEVLDRLRRQRRPAADATLPDLVGQTARYQSVAAPFLRQAAHSGAGFVTGAASTGLSPDSTTDTSADKWAADLAVELIMPLRERLERALQEDTNDEGDNAAVSERLSASYRQWKLQQVEQVVRHYSSAAFALGAFGAADDDATLRWVVDDDGPCPDCEDNALAGPTPKGLQFPTGQTHPPAHPGCRCLLVPIGV